VICHLGKMFASINVMRYDVSNDESCLLTLTEMGSKDGEFIKLEQNIKVRNKQPVKEWLQEVESEMQKTLAAVLSRALNDDRHQSDYINWASEFPAQIMILASLVIWTMEVEKSLREGEKGGITSTIKTVESQLDSMASTVLLNLPTETRKKYEQLITELVHQRDVTRLLKGNEVTSPNDFRWLTHLRYTYDSSASKANLKQRLNIRMANASFYYGFEYLGIGERLVQTPLTDRCYLTLTQALHFRLGGNPFGPAGTGKTESVKALGAQLGRFVLVFNCDESFDFGAMGR